MDSRSQEALENNVIKWHITREGKEKVVDLLVYDHETTPPDGYYELITIQRAAVIEGDVLGRLKSLATGSKDGVLRAALELEDLIAGLVERKTCIRFIKQITDKKNVRRSKFNLPIVGMFWVTKDDLPLVMCERGVTSSNISGVGKSKLRIESSVEWPNCKELSIPGIDAETDVQLLPKSMFRTNSPNDIKRQDRPSKTQPTIKSVYKRR